MFDIYTNGDYFACLPGGHRPEPCLNPDGSEWGSWNYYCPAASLAEADLVLDEMQRSADECGASIPQWDRRYQPKGIGDPVSTKASPEPA